MGESRRSWQDRKNTGQGQGEADRILAGRRGPRPTGQRIAAPIPERLGPHEILPVVHEVADMRAAKERHGNRPQDKDGKQEKEPEPVGTKGCLVVV